MTVDDANERERQVMRRSVSATTAGCIVRLQAQPVTEETSQAQTSIGQYVNTGQLAGAEGLALGTGTGAEASPVACVRRQFIVVVLACRQHSLFLITLDQHSQRWFLPLLHCKPPQEC
jgi:hypothetical protein